MTRNDSLKTLSDLFSALLKISLPFAVIFFLIWQSAVQAHLNRQIKYLSNKKEQLTRQNYDMKAKIVASYSPDRVASMYRQSFTRLKNYSNDRVITLSLPKERNSAELKP